MENIVSKCEIVLNFSKRILKSITNIDIITEENYQFYISSINTFHYRSSLDSILELYHQTQKIISSFSSCKCEEEEDSIESFQASKFIEDYFVAKREIIKSNFDDLIAMLRITIFISILRKQYEKRKIILPSAISNINFVDVFMGIIIYESICGIKYGRQASSFGNLSEKIMLYDYASEIKKIIQKKKEEEKKSLNLIPRSKTMKKAVVMQEFNFFGKNEKIEKKCELCQEIEKVSGGKDIICDFIDKVNLFAYNKEINFFN